MKTIKKNLVLAVSIIAASTLISFDGLAQKRLANGTIIYPDGTKVKPGNTVINPQLPTGRNGVYLPDGRVIVPGDNRNYPVDRRNVRNGKRIPPGQAKKIYGGHARDYAPGQQKKYNNSVTTDIFGNPVINQNDFKKGNKGKGRKH